MTNADTHDGCSSYVRISKSDRSGPLGYAFDLEHPASLKYPGLVVGACERAAGHCGLCEMYVDSTDEGTVGHWIRWQAPEVKTSVPLPVLYEWVHSGVFCEEVSANGLACSRPRGPRFRARVHYLQPVTGGRVPRIGPGIRRPPGLGGSGGRTWGGYPPAWRAAISRSAAAARSASVTPAGRPES